jgi:hypothetical protein
MTYHPESGSLIGELVREMYLVPSVVSKVILQTVDVETFSCGKLPKN